MKKPYIISFSGIDGSGKTTQLTMLADHLRVIGFKVKTTKVQFAALEVVYEYCRRNFGDPSAYGLMPPEVVRMGLAYDVAHHYLQLEKEPEEYDFLLCDRHKIDFIAYGIAYGCDPKAMEWVEKILSLVNEPDLIVYFKTEIKTSQARIRQRSSKQPRSDEEPGILGKAGESFENLMRHKENAITINGNQSQTETFALILNTLKQRKFV